MTVFWVFVIAMALIYIAAISHYIGMMLYELVREVRRVANEIEEYRVEQKDKAKDERIWTP